MKQLGPDDVKAGDVIEVLVAHNGTDQRKSMRDRRRCRVIWAGPKFVTALVPRGAGSARESFAYDEILAVNPSGLDEPVLQGKRPLPSLIEDVQKGARVAMPMSRKSRLPDETVDRIIALAKQGKSINAIAQEVGVTFRTAKRHVDRVHSGGEAAPKETTPSATASTEVEAPKQEELIPSTSTPTGVKVPSERFAVSREPVSSNSWAEPPAKLVGYEAQVRRRGTDIIVDVLEVYEPSSGPLVRILYNGERVLPPSRFERFLGITWEAKVRKELERARAKAKRMEEELLESEGVARAVGAVERG